MALGRFSLVGLLMVGAALTTGCASETSDDSGSGAAAISGAETPREVKGSVDPATGVGKVTITTTLHGANLADVKRALEGLKFWTDLKRPADTQLSAGEGQLVHVKSAGSPIFSKVEQDKKDSTRINAFMPMSASGIQKFSGVDFALTRTMAPAVPGGDFSDGLVFTVTNPTTIEAQLKGLGFINVDIVKKGQLTLSVTAKPSADGVDVVIQEDVVAAKKEKVAGLLASAIAVADGLESRFNNAPVAAPE